MNTRQKGDEAERFVAEYLHKIGFVTEIHPRTFRLVYLKGGKVIHVSQDNDYNKVFDVKAEGIEWLIYAQVKFMPNNTVSNGHMSSARKKIDQLYPYAFTYVKPQVWQVWKEWVSKPRRHKEFRFRVWERQGFHEIIKHGIPVVEGNWVEITCTSQKEEPLRPEATA